MLFGEGREQGQEPPKTRKRNGLLYDTCRTSGCLLEYQTALHRTGQKPYIDEIGRPQYSNVALNAERSIVTDNDKYPIRPNKGVK